MSKKLTEFNPGSGCGCKMSPADLREMLEGSGQPMSFDQLIVGHGTSDDAAVWKREDGSLLLHTTDFFTPIVDDAFDFGRIAATNALSDIYAMGGKPTTALAILGWPVDELPLEQASRVIVGAREVCQDAGFPLAGGHSINLPSPIFGLSVTGEATPTTLISNADAEPGDLIFLTKPLGIGMMATAIKKGIASVEDVQWSLDVMTQLNDIGASIAEISEVHAMTDVTGFGLLGHLLEMCRASNVSAVLDWDKIPALPQGRLEEMVASFCLPQGTTKNYSDFVQDINQINGKELALLCDPQTSGGLLISAAPSVADLVATMLAENGWYAEPIGHIVAEQSPRVTLRRKD